MIRFMFKTLPQLKVLNCLNWIMRLDTDTMLTMPLPDYPFAQLAQRGCVYGYAVATFDSAFVSEGLRAFAEDYAKAHGLTPSLPLTQWGQPVGMYYNNFEILDLNFFRRTDVREWTQAVDQSFNIFRHRWGDAPLRYLTTALFAKRELICHVPVHYLHSGSVVEPVSLEQLREKF